MVHPETTDLLILKNTEYKSESEKKLVFNNHSYMNFSSFLLCLYKGKGSHNSGA